jgi:GntR family transcriptional regulator
VEAPLHERVAADLRARILSGELPVGAAVPSEAELCLQWRGSRGPVRQALASLRAEGLISGGRGKPPTVQRRELAQPFDSFVSFSRWAHMLGLPPGQNTVEIARRRATEDIAVRLDIPIGEPVVQLLRQRTLAGEPVMVERTTFVRAWGSLLFEHDPDSGSIYEHLIGKGLQVGVARHTIDAVQADEHDRDLLGVAVGAPLLREVRIAYDSGGEAFEYSDDRYRPDRVTFTIDNAPEGRPLFGRTWHTATRPRPERSVP